MNKNENNLKDGLKMLPEDHFVLFSSVTKKGREEIYNTLSEYLEN